MNPKAATPLDVELGRRIRAARENAGITQTALAERVGITFQQIQKYEWGKNRMSVARLLTLAAALNTSTESLLEDLTDMARAQNRQPRSGSRKK